MSTATAVNIPTGEQDTLTAGELRAWRGLLRAHACLARRLDAELDQAHGLPMTSYEVLHHLDDALGGRMRMRDLAEQAQLSRSGLTRLLDRLQFTRRPPSDECHYGSPPLINIITRPIIKSEPLDIKSSSLDILRAAGKALPHGVGRIGPRRREVATLLGRLQQPLQGAMRSHMSASTLSSSSEKREKKCSLTTASCVTRASSRRSRPRSVRHA